MAVEIPHCEGELTIDDDVQAGVGPDGPYVTWDPVSMAMACHWD